jgi:hypothetical protein
MDDRRGQQGRGGGASSYSVPVVTRQPYLSDTPSQRARAMTAAVLAAVEDDTIGNNH